jgi:large subunit ribosomal protein L30
LGEEPKERKCLAVVRVRGTISASREARESLEMLHLIRNNQAILIDNRPSFLGMLKTAQNFVTWGEVSKETVNLLITQKGRLAGNKKLTDEYAKRAGFTSLDGLLDAVCTCHVEYWKLPNVQAVFRLHPPSKGFRGKIKKSYNVGGELGYRGEKINELVSRMV